MSKWTTRVGVAIGVAVALTAGLDLAAQRGVSPVTDATLRNPAPGDWLMWRRTLNSWGYSPLDQINRANVRQLAMVWSRPLAPGIQEGTPLVHDGVMFMPNPLDMVHALHVTSVGTVSSSHSCESRDFVGPTDRR